MAPPPEPACIGDECSAPLEKVPRYEQPGPDEGPPHVMGTPAELASCAIVGEALASAELGNYADPEDRAPIAAKHAATCKALRLDQATRTCIAQQQGDKISIAYCSPEMVPDTKLHFVAPAECAALIKAASDRFAGRASYDWEKKWWTARADLFLASCKRDRWTAQVGECVKNGQAQYCSQYQEVRPLQVKLTAMHSEANRREQERRELWSRAYDAPAKYPQVKIELVKASACPDIIAAVTTRVEKLGPQSWEKTWWTPRAKAYLASCKKDRWTVEVGDCMKTLPPNTCYQYAPPTLQQKLVKLYQQ